MRGGVTAPLVREVASGESRPVLGRARKPPERSVPEDRRKPLALSG